MKTVIAGIDRTFRRGRGNMMATQWEYKVIRFPYGGGAEKELNTAGSDGWEAVATTGDLTFSWVILKRQKSK